MKPHVDCGVCSYWLFRVAEEKARALAGDKSAYVKEQRARTELDAHLKRAKHMEAASCSS
jgi:hypothetical protein